MQGGYAIAVHGSQERDLDVIAAPWTEDAVSVEELLAHLAAGLPGTVQEVENKPLGRVAATIKQNGWYRPIDLSICPRII